MKKSLFVLGVAAAVLTGCSQSEVTDIAESSAIKFSKAFVGNPTKSATVVDNDNIQSFYVYAYKNEDALLTNENVYLQNGLWAYDNIKIWDDAATYSFAAYSNGGTAKGVGSLENVSYDKNAGTLKISSYTAGGDDDLLASISTETLAEANTPVAFTFKHVLSMVKFTVKSGLGNDKELVINNLTVEAGKIQNNGDLTYSTAATNWELAQSGQTYASLSAADLNATTETPAEAEFTVLPQEVSGGFTVTIEATITPEGESAINKTFTATIPADNAKWKVGNRYNYIATINATDMNIIEFDAPKVDDWNNILPGTDVDVTEQN
ncbi:fimbrillin family protein [Coprobacter secundus]|uniref:fimbrillin family protein n=1 Tax=Coprobacter secundus TaxID=1501392 RepID=UPI0023F90D9E|nr:fimbrillin family protein [Coprobacter secundus]